jgi:hypothetical protein
MWTCPKCSARVEAPLDVCWRCGTSPEGVEDPDFVTADEAPPIDDPTGYLQLDAGDPGEEGDAGPPLDLVACYETNDVAEAKFVADELLAEGIPATLQNTHRATYLPQDAYSLYPCRVVVRATDLPRAQGWVQDYRKRRRARDPQGE